MNHPATEFNNIAAPDACMITCYLLLPYVKQSCNLAVMNSLKSLSCMKIVEKRIRRGSWELTEFTLVLMGCVCNACMSENLQARGGNSQQTLKDKIQSNDTENYITFDK